MTTPDDYYRRCAYESVRDWLTTHSSNAVSSAQIWHAVNVALDRYDDEVTQAAELYPGYAIIIDANQVMTVRTRRQARQQRRLLNRQWPGKYKIRPTKILLD